MHLPQSDFDLQAWLIVVAFSVFIGVVFVIDWLLYWPDEGWRKPRRVAREVWAAARAKYFANRHAGTRPKEGL